MERISFIGMGDLGTPMAVRLLEAGYQVTVYNRTAIRADEITNRGGIWAESLADCLREADYIFIKVSYQQDVEDLYFGEEGICAIAPENSVVVDMTTKSPELASRIADEAAERNIAVIDAPVIGGTSDAEAGTLRIVLGGDSEACQRVTPVLEHLSNSISYVGANEASQQMKMAAQIAIAGILSGLSESMAYSVRANLDKKLILKLLEEELTSNTATLLQMEESPDAMSDSALTVRHMLTDFQTAKEDAQSRNLNLGVLNTVTDLYDQMNREGYGHAGTNFLMAYYNSFTRNGTMLQYFEWYLPSDGNLWNQLAANAASLEAMGFTAIWTPPAYKSLRGVEDVGYGVYDVYDLGEFDQKGTVRTKYGTREEYQMAIHACHEAGLHVYPDIVLNHKLGADAREEVEAIEVSPDNRNYEIGENYQTVEAETIYNFEGRGNQYSDFKWDHRHFSGFRNEEPQGSPIYKLKDHEWSPNVDNEFGNFDYLMGADIDHQNPEVVEELGKWGTWYEGMTEMDGVRLDAVKHIDAYFYRDWLHNMRESTGRNLFAVGEYWSGDVQKLTRYLEQVDYQMSLFDVPLHFHFCDASYNRENYDLRNIFKGTLTEWNPIHSVPFVDNHDTQPGQSLASPVKPWFRSLAYAMILLRQDGYPCVFYGDLYGIPHNNVPPVGQDLELMLMVRRMYAYGRQNDYFTHKYCIGWTREKYGIAVLISSRGRHRRRMFVGKEFAGKTYYDVLGHSDRKVTITRQGYGEFSVEDQSVSVWMDEELGLTPEGAVVV